MWSLLNIRIGPPIVPSTRSRQCRFAPQATGYGLFWLLIGFAGIAAINGRLFVRVFSKYIAASASDETQG